MAKVKFTQRKSRSEIQSNTGAHGCRFPGCNRTFAFRQGMSRHMRRVHQVKAKDFMSQKKGPYAPMFAEEKRVTDAFQGGRPANPDRAEDLLTTRSLEQILDSLATVHTLAPTDDVEAESLGSLDSPSLQLDTTVDMSGPAAYAHPDAPDADIQAPVDVDTGSGTAPVFGVRRVRRTTRDGKIRRGSGQRPPPALPGRGKDIRPDFDIQWERARWPARLSCLPHTDLVKVMEVLPLASSVDMAKATAEHFEVTKGQAIALRRRFAAMVAVEQNVLARIRRLLPVGADAESSLLAVKRIDDFCAKFEGRSTSLPFE